LFSVGFFFVQIKDAILNLAQEEFEDIKVVIRIRKIKEEQTTQWAKEEEQTTQWAKDRVT
jgi:hypothetical protein